MFQVCLIKFNAILEQIIRKQLQVLTLPGYILYFPTALYFQISIRIFRNLFIWFVFDGLLQSIFFRMFCSKHSISFDTYLLICRFHYVDLFYINFRSCETFIITNYGAILLPIKTLSNFRTMKCRFILYQQTYVLGWCKFKCFLYPAWLSCVSHFIDICTVKLSKICTLIQPIKLQIFCILTIRFLKSHVKIKLK